jgi:hypothetical protein
MGCACVARIYDPFCLIAYIVASRRITIWAMATACADLAVFFRFVGSSGPPRRYARSVTNQSRRRALVSQRNHTLPARNARRLMAASEAHSDGEQTSSRLWLHSAPGKGPVQGIATHVPRDDGAAILPALGRVETGGISGDL